MTPGRIRHSWIVLTAAGSLPLLGGCVGQNSLLTSRTTVGSLRTSVSHLGYENEQLRRQVADLKTENRGLEDRLVQEEAHNGDLAARLDDARQALRGQGLDESTSAVDPNPSGSASRALPAGRSTKKKRKLPYAEIPGQVDTLPPTDDNGMPVRVPRAGDPGPQSHNEDDHWLPVARVPLLPPSQVR